MMLLNFSKDNLNAKMIRYLFTLVFISTTCVTTAQSTNFTLADTVRGFYGATRSWWDVSHYKLEVSFDIKNQSIQALNTIACKKITAGKVFQIDLQDPLIMDSILLLDAAGKVIKTYHNVLQPGTQQAQYRRVANGYFAELNETQLTGNTFFIKAYYHGKPRAAVTPPWDGGVIWKKDEQNNPWVSVACQGLGASVWYPCKDHQADEPDSADLLVTVDTSLTTIANGRMKGRKLNADGTATTHWAVTSPINNYNIIPYIGKYELISEVYDGEKGPLTMDYWVLTGNASKAREHFADAKKMMKAFEYWFGPYPFYEDGYKLVEAPHLGMEHQSAIAYGNQYKKGYLGKDLSGTGQGLKFDFIIVHESGHEWFGNNITTKDIADMWVHESFTNYSETLFIEYYFGKDAGTEYVAGTRKNIENDKPIIGMYNVNNEGSGDMYYKGGNMIHLIRQMMGNDEKFRMMLRKMNQEFYHTTVTGNDIENFMIRESGLNLRPVFDQYLRSTSIPVLFLSYDPNGQLAVYRFTDANPGFTIPVRLIDGKKSFVLNPTTNLKTISNSKLSKEAEIDMNYYINLKKTTGNIFKRKSLSGSHPIQ